MLATLRDEIFRPAVVERAVALALEELSPARRDVGRERLEVELATVQAECDRLAEAIGRGGPLDSLLARLTERQTRRRAIEADLLVAPRHASRSTLRPWRAV